jgi:hypothetical protein
MLRQRWGSIACRHCKMLSWRFARVSPSRFDALGGEDVVDSAKARPGPLVLLVVWPLCAGLQTFPVSPGNGEVRPYCDIGRSSSGRPLPDPTAGLSTLSVLAKESGRP